MPHEMMSGQRSVSAGQPASQPVSQSLYKCELSPATEPFRKLAHPERKTRSKQKQCNAMQSKGLIDR
jgi:hypothetical protein